MKTLPYKSIFLVVFVLHALLVRFFLYSECGSPPTWMDYVVSGDVFLGFSYALGAAFATWSLGRFLVCRSAASATGVAGGTLLVAGFAGAACFFSGCCGSPMLVVYAGLFGFNSLAIPKWGIALLTVVTATVGWWWQRRSLRCSCKIRTDSVRVTQA